jgi:hypothetical protein
MEYYEIPNGKGRVAIVQSYVDLSLKDFGRFEIVSSTFVISPHSVTTSSVAASETSGTDR